MMKKTFLLFAIGAMAITANAQDIKIGPRLGLTSSSIKVDKNSTGGAVQAQFESGDAKIGYQAGLFGRLAIAGFYLQPELLFSSTGGEIVVSSDVVTDQVQSLSFKNLSVPIMFGKKFAGLVRVNVGPSFNYLLKAETEIAGVAADVKDNYNNASVGFQAGAGVDLGPLVLDLKYEGSLSKLGDAVGGFNTDQRQSIWILALGYSFK